MLCQSLESYGSMLLCDHKIMSIAIIKIYIGNTREYDFMYAIFHAEHCSRATIREIGFGATRKIPLVYRILLRIVIFLFNCSNCFFFENLMIIYSFTGVGVN